MWKLWLLDVDLLDLHLSAVVFKTGIQLKTGFFEASWVHYEFISTKGWFTTDLLPYIVTAEVTRQAKSHCTHSTESGHCVTFSSVPNHQSYHTKLHLHKWKGKLPCLAILGLNDPHDEKCLLNVLK